MAGVVSQQRPPDTHRVEPERRNHEEYRGADYWGHGLRRLKISICTRRVGLSLRNDEAVCHDRQRVHRH